MSCKLSKDDKIRYLHLVIIFIGTIFIAINIFHSNLWFDECYSVSIAKHSFYEIWTIGSNDVHPILYYYVLHIVGIFTNYNIIVLRLVSFFPLVILGILGYTHIKKDFGYKTGIVFSFLMLFLPVSAEYAGEIRMYTLGLMLGTIMSIYAYRIYKGQDKIRNFIIFGINSLLVSYTHYYGLMLAGIVNLLLFIYYIKNSKTKKNGIKRFIVTAIIQVILYLPWVMSFFKQIQGVSNGFWISLTFPKTLIEIISMQFTGSLDITIGFIFALFIFTYITYVFIKYVRQTRKEIETKSAIISIGIYIAIILIALIISLCIQSILLYRYLLIPTGLLIFTLAFIISRDTNRYRIITVCIIILLMSIISNIGLIKNNYDSSNINYLKYIQNNIKEEDLILYSDAISGAVVSAYFDNQSYFYNKQNWNVEESYKAFSNMKIVYDLKDVLYNYEGRVWLIEGNTSTLLDETIEYTKKSKLIYKKTYETKYKNNIYTIELIDITK